MILNTVGNNSSIEVKMNTVGNIKYTQLKIFLLMTFVMIKGIF